MHPQVLESDRVILAKVPGAIHFSFNSRDSPDLEQQVRKMRNTWTELFQNTTQRRPQLMMNEFDDLLSFVERKPEASDENVLATGVKFIPVLQKSWKILMQNLEPVVSTPVPNVATADTIAKASLKKASGEESGEGLTETEPPSDKIEEMQRRFARWFR